MRTRIKKLGMRGLLAVLAVCVALLPGRSVRAAGSLLDSPYVVPYYYREADGTYSQYFTVSQPQPVDFNSGDTEYVYHYYGDYAKSGTAPSYWLPQGTTVETGIASSLRALVTGEHYYDAKRVGEVPIGKWVVMHSPGKCIHTGNQTHEWKGLSVGDDICQGTYYSGWLCYCADCGRLLLNSLVYSPQDRIETIDYMNMDYGYYYICPNPACYHLENEGYAMPHTCQLISPNMYKIVYDGNGAIPTKNGYFDINGYMQPSFHMYDNATEYEGRPIEPVTHLNICSYTRLGYTFTGWNTKPDGSGVSYADGAEILNLSEYHYLDENRETDPRGVVTLYAQWKLTESILRIDPADGRYDGKSGYTDIIRKFGDTYLADPALVTADPKNKVSYDTNGGANLGPTAVPRKFTSWKQGTPFHGKMRENVYYYTAADGNVDVLTAQYTNEEILLPTPSKTGYSFGGWYEDPECDTVPVGFGGDRYLAQTDTTLYAKWVNLTLWSFENYIDNHKKGAADLRWLEPDDWIKTYKLYRSDDGSNFTQISSADGSMSVAAADKTYDYTGTAKTYTIPSTGFYEITAYGAQGQDYGDKIGGYGGRVTAKVYLKKGEVLTVIVGGQNGYGGGGTASKYGGGGGGTSITSNVTGTILVAGGGGGATEFADGEAGGLETALRTDGSSVGENGSAGGGGGYVGGKSGAVFSHRHDENCLVQHIHVPECWEEKKVEQICTITNKRMSLSEDKQSERWCDVCGAITIRAYYHFNASHGSCGAPPWGGPCENSDYGDGSIHSGCWACMTCGTEYTWYGGLNPSDNSHKYYIKEWIAICGMEEVECCKYGYEEGQLVSSSNAYGGSSYATDRAVTASSSGGVREGNGRVEIQPLQVGLSDDLELKGVEAPDLAAPDPVVFQEPHPLSNTAFAVTWDEPKDNGTQYWFRCESYQADSGEKICDSNVTSNVLTTGVAGYYYVYDKAETKTVTAENADNKGSLLKTSTVNCIVGEDVQYLHVAPVDVAGNIGETRDIMLVPGGSYAWPIMTDQVQISSVLNGQDYESVYEDPGTGTIYVNGTGNLPFRLSFSSYMNGYASADYQIDGQEFFVALDLEGKEQIFQTIVPKSADLAVDGALSVSGFVRSVNGRSLIGDVSRTGASRLLAGTQNFFWQGFTAPGELHGKTVVVTPGASAGEEHSDWDDDTGHSIHFIPDGEAPKFSVNQNLESLTVINADTLADQSIIFTATDDLAGLKKFVVKVVNQDNGDTRTYYGDADGKVQINFDPTTHLFDGDITFELSAWDNVSNKSEKIYGKAEYTMTAEILHAGYNPSGMTTFRRGEPALLHVVTTGYADTIRIEVPAHIVPGYPSDKVDLFGLTSYRTNLNVNFTIPYECPAGAYSFIVHSYKNGEELEARPVMITITENPVGGDVRVRIR